AGFSESRRVWVEGFVARQFTALPSSHEGDGSLLDYLREAGVPALDGLDTRAVVRRLRRHGALRGVVASERSDAGAPCAELADSPTVAGGARGDEVPCRGPSPRAPEGALRSRLAVFDYGVKRNILGSLTRRGAEVTVLPARTPARQVLDGGYDGVVL